MKVTKITNFPVQSKEGGVYYIVRVDTDAGIHGLGEVGIRSWGRAIANAVDHLGELVIGADPWET
ncbi:MAG: mandelate racemase/muconate lactonizing enzyme family protein, partial [Dehalococcoidia bacterium]|nr:mandelate racemase/muconate lactonizing enzyme family protein [Dehalococcoidia bacterium]